MVNHSETEHQLDYWMLTEIALILGNEELKRIKSSDFGRAMHSIHKKGTVISEETQKKIDYDLASLKGNRFGSVGRVSLILKRVQEIKDDYATALEKEQSRFNTLFIGRGK